MKTKTFFYLEPYTYLKIIDNHILLYNTLNGAIIKKNDNDSLLKLFKRIEKNNYYGIILTKKELQNATIRKFINLIRNNFIGDFIKIENTIKGQLPFAMKNGINITLDREIISPTKTKIQKKIVDPFEYLRELTIYFDTDCKYDCEYCSYARSQIHCCSKIKTKKK